MFPLEINLLPLIGFFFMYVWTFFKCKLFNFFPLVYDKLRPFSLADRINIKLPKELGAFSCIWCAILCVHSYMNVLPRNEFLLVFISPISSSSSAFTSFLYSGKKSMMLLLYIMCIYLICFPFFILLYSLFFLFVCLVWWSCKEWKKLIGKK